MFFSAPTLPPIQKPAVTVFVHGTHRLPRLVPKTMNSLYQRFNYKPGLHSLKNCPRQFCYARFLKRIAYSERTRFPLDHCYLFCWPGGLDNAIRLEAARELHQELTKLHKKYKEYQLTVITHSHGGNVVLNLAMLNIEKEYQIDTLILLACPVQECNKQGVFSSLFKEIYAPYSSWDILQVLDPQGAVPTRREVRCLFTQKKCIRTKKHIPLFSARCFSKESKVKHIHVTRKWRPITHLEFLLPSFSRKLGRMLEKAETHNFSRSEMKYRI